MFSVLFLIVRGLSRDQSLERQCVESLTIVAQKLDALWERIQQLAVNLARDLCGIKRPVCDADAIQSAGFALGNEFVSVGGLGLDHVCDVGDGLPCYVSAVRDSC